MIGLVPADRDQAARGRWQQGEHEDAEEHGGERKAQQTGGEQTVHLAMIIGALYQTRLERVASLPAGYHATETGAERPMQRSGTGRQQQSVDGGPAP